VISEVTNVEKEFEMFKTLKFNGKEKRRGPEPRPLLQATILFHLRGRLTIRS
jgi:hypothetical protein